MHDPDGTLTAARTLNLIRKNALKPKKLLMTPKTNREKTPESKPKAQTPKP